MPPNRPVRRPSLPVTVADTHGRMRTQEASYHMPYFAGRVQYYWEPNQDPPWEGTSTTISVLDLRPYGECGAGLFYKCIDTINTDESLVSPAEDVALAVCEIKAPGLWAWWAELTVYNNDVAVDAEFAVSSFWYNTLAGPQPQTLDIRRAGAVAADTAPNPVAVPAQDFRSVGWSGIWSWDGTFGLYSRAPRRLEVTVVKGTVAAPDASYDFNIVYDIYACRFSPVGWWSSNAE